MSSKKAKAPPLQLDPAAIDAAKARMKTELVQDYVDKIKSGEKGALEIVKALTKIVDETRQQVSTNASPEGGRKLPKTAEYQLQKYRDALILLNVLEGKPARESANVNRNVAAVEPILTARVATRKASQKNAREEKSAAAAITRKLEKAMSAATQAKAKANAIAAALERGNSPNSVAASVASTSTAKAKKPIVSPERLGRLIAKYPRSEERTAQLQKLIGPVIAYQAGEEKQLKYIVRSIEALETQALRFNPKAKADFAAEIEEQQAKLRISMNKMRKKKTLTEKAEADTNVKLAALKRLHDAIEAETNVELAEENKPTKAKKKRTHKKMGCKILRHPCNSKYSLTLSELEAVVAEIKATGKATHFPTMKLLSESAAASAAASAATSAAASPANNAEE
jgi:hypothetical protein